MTGISNIQRDIGFILNRHLLLCMRKRNRTAMHSFQFSRLLQCIHILPHRFRRNLQFTYEVRIMHDPIFV